MKTVRQDAWTVEDDNVLADIILRQIRTGGTQLAAFQEAGMKLGRTQAACGFRWNGVVRKQYTAQIEIAKADRRTTKELQQQSSQGPSTESLLADEGEDGNVRTNLSWNDVLRFLRTQRSESQVLASRLRQLERDLETKTSEEERLRAENRSLHSELERIESELTVLREDHRALVSIMERARKMVFLGEQYQEERAPKFKMDENGNLERIE
ncbi:MAG: RsfA family transcriptional regulator [Tumebacillaceae bacterium]